MTYWKRLTPASPNLDRIKVLWIDDRSENLGQVTWLSQMFGKYFDIYYACVPEEVGASLREIAPEIVTQYGGPSYELPSAPFDVYLADWDLTAAPVSRTLGRPSEAKNADAAGLATATLSACHFPRHPAAIVPYSAQWTSLEAHGKLHQAMAPGYIYVAWQDGQQLKADQVTKVLPVVICSCFRKALAQAARWGHIYFPAQGITDATSGLASAPETREWLERSHIVYESAWGRRKIRQMALWLDLFEPNTAESPAANRVLRLLSESCALDPPATPVQDPAHQRRELIRGWLSALPRYLDDLSKVVNLVQHYWQLARSQKSRLRYRLSNILTTDPARRTMYDDLEAESIAQVMGLRYTDLKTKTAKEVQAIAITDAEWACPPIYDLEELGDGAEGLERQRLAVLMLSVLARARQPVTPLSEEPDWFDREWIGQAILSNALYSKVEALLAANQRANAVALICEGLCKTIETDGEEDRDYRFRTRYTPKSAGEYLSQLINPLPTTALAPGVGSHEQLGKALSKRSLSLVELWSDTPPTAHDDVSALKPLQQAASENAEVKVAVNRSRTEQPPYGFRVEPGEDRYPVLVSDPGETMALRQIFDRFLATENVWSFLDNIRRDAAIPKPTRGGKEKAWDLPTLLVSLLKNDAYIGAAAVKGITGCYKDHDAVIAADVFNKVQRKCYYPTNRETRILQNWAHELEWPKERWWSWLKREIPHVTPSQVSP